MLLPTRHEWLLEGDLSARVYLDLDFFATVHGLGIDTLELVSLDVAGVTFAIRNMSLPCDGARRSQPELPDALKLWLVNRFKAEYENNANLQQEFQDKLEQRAIDAHFEAVSA